jgi:hypothetical protein
MLGLRRTVVAAVQHGRDGVHEGRECPRKQERSAPTRSSLAFVQQDDFVRFGSGLVGETVLLHPVDEGLSRDREESSGA